MGRWEFSGGKIHRQVGLIPPRGCSEKTPRSATPSVPERDGSHLFSLKFLSSPRPRKLRAGRKGGGGHVARRKGRGLREWGERLSRAPSLSLFLARRLPWYFQSLQSPATLEGAQAGKEGARLGWRCGLGRRLLPSELLSAAAAATPLRPSRGAPLPDLRPARAVAETACFPRPEPARCRRRRHHLHLRRLQEDVAPRRDDNFLGIVAGAR